MLQKVSCSELRKDYGVFQAPLEGKFVLEMDFELDIKFHLNSSLSGVYTLSPTMVMRYTNPSTIRNPLTEYGFYNLDFSKVFKGDFDQVDVRFTAHAPSLMNLNPFSFRIFIFDEKNKTFTLPDGLDDKDSIQSLNFTLHQVSGKVVTIGIFAYDNIQIVELSDMVPIYYRRTIQFNWKLCGIEKVRVTFPKVAITNPETAPIFSFDSSTSYRWEYVTPFTPLSQNAFSLTQPVDMFGSYLSFKRDSFSEVCNMDGNRVKIEEGTIGCAFVFPNSSNLTYAISSIELDGEIRCKLPQNETKFNIILVAKQYHEPAPISSIIDNVQPLTANSTNRFTLVKGDQISCSITLGGNSKLTLSVKAAFDPDVYIGMNIMPTQRVFDYFMDGTSTKNILNPSPTPLKILILIDGSYSKGTGVVMLTPTISEYVPPKRSFSVGKVDQMILIGATVAALTLGLLMVAGIIALFIVITRKKDVARSFVESKAGGFNELLLHE